jgi:hypothetical protein
MAGIKDFSTTAANNTTVGSISVAEGMLPSNINNAFRGLAAEIREWYNDSQWVIYGDGDGSFTITYASATSFTVSGVDVTSFYHVGRRVKAIATTPGTIYGTISASTFSTNTTVTVTWDSGSLANEAVTIYVSALSKTNDSIPELVITNAKISASAAIDLTKIGSGAVSSTEFGYLDGVTSAIQTQLDAKLVKANNLSDLTSTSTARTNLGLGTIATQAASAVAITGGSISGLSSPTTGSEPTTKTYVDNLVTGLSTRIICRAASTADVTIASALENGDTLDGVTLVTGDRVLLKNQTTDSQNGIYTVVASGSASRDTQFDTITELAGQLVIIQEGTVNADTFHLCTTDTSATLGSSSISFTKVTPSNSGTVTSIATGTGLTGGTITSSGTLAIDTGVVTTLTGTQTLTNKTLTLPTIDNIKIGYSTTATAASTTTLTVSSNYKQYFTGSTTQTIVLPVVTTLTLGHTFEIHNNSSGSLTVNSSGSNLVGTINANTTAICTCILTTGTTAASWDFDLTGFTTALPITRGGTGLTALGTSLQSLRVNSGATALEFATASAGFSGANENSIGSSAITLTSASAQYQKVQISTLANSFVTLPSATTLTSEGTPVYAIENNSPIGAGLDIKNNGGTIIGTIADNTVGFCSLIDNSTSNGTWNISNTINTAVQTISSTVNSNTSTNHTLAKVIHLTATKLVLVNFHKTSATVLTGYFKIGDLSGDTITFGTQQTTTITSGGTTDGGFRGDIVRLSDSAFILMWGTLTSDGGAIRRVSANTVSGTTITFGTQNALSFPNTSSDYDVSIASGYNGMCCRMADDKFAVIYNTTTVSGTGNWLRAYSGSLGCNIITVSGTTLTVGTRVDLGTSTYTQPTTLVCHDTDRLCVMFYQHTSGSGNGKNKINIISVSGTTPTWGTSVDVEASDITDVWDGLSIVYAWFSGTVAQSTSLNNMYGVAFSTTSVLGLGGGSGQGTYVFISISGTTPTVVATKKGLGGFGLHVPPCAINSTTVFLPNANALNGRYLICSSSGIKFSPQLTLTAQSANLTAFAMYLTTPRGTSASTSFTIFGNISPTYIATGTFSV